MVLLLRRVPRKYTLVGVELILYVCHASIYYSFVCLSLICSANAACMAVGIDVVTAAVAVVAVAVLDILAVRVTGLPLRFCEFAIYCRGS